LGLADNILEVTFKDTEDPSADGGQLTMIERPQLPQDTWVIKPEDGQELSLRTVASLFANVTVAPGHRFGIRSIAEQGVLIAADRIGSLFNTLAPQTSRRPS
jgi:hypothetical protein